MGNPQRAVHELRASLRSGRVSADLLLNTALALWNLNSLRKAIAYARRAATLDPGRRDIAVRFLGMLESIGEYDTLAEELRLLRKSDIVPPPEMLDLEAHVMIRRGKHRKSLELLRRAIDVAPIYNASEDYVAELHAKREYAQARYSKSARNGSRARILALIDKHPTNIVIYQALVDFEPGKPDRVAIERYFPRVCRSADIVSRKWIEYHRAWSECRFYAAYRHAKEWVAVDSSSLTAVISYFLLECLVAGDMKRASAAALDAVDRFPASIKLCNDAAFVLAMAKKSGEAQRVLDAVDNNTPKPYFYLATTGLVKISSGDIEEGLALYRQAGILADKMSDGSMFRALMTYHQALAIMHLGLFERPGGLGILARALPPVDPPSDWKERPDFVLMSKVARTRGWPWPLVLE
jgi:tetratricopeptide (TPR) repeat protein